MTELILKQSIDDDKLKTLLDFLKSWGVDVEVRNLTDEKQADLAPQQAFPFSIGIWNDYTVDDKTLRRDAWKRDVV